MARNGTTAVLEAIRKECQLVGAVADSTRVDNTRVRVTLQNHDGDHRGVTFSDPADSDQHAHGNILAEVRRRLRELGFDVNRAHMKPPRPTTPEAPMAKGTSDLTRAEGGQATLLINSHGRKDGDVWHYATGWDDERVATTISTPTRRVRPELIAELRREVFGPVEAEEVKRTEALGLPYVNEQLRKHDKALAEINARLGRLIEQLGADDTTTHAPINGAAHHG